LFSRGKSFGLFPLKIYYTFVAGMHVQVKAGFGVSKRNFKKAVHRNRIKRLLREGYRLQKHELYTTMQNKPQQLLLFFLYTGKELPAYELIQSKMQAALKKISTEIVQ
jgi:ribonuclease P protein component